MQGFQIAIPKRFRPIRFNISKFREFRFHYLNVYPHQISGFLVSF